MAKSLAERVAELDAADREAAIAGLDPDALLWDWSFWSRPEQSPPKNDDWAVWLYLAGRGGGKTRSAAEWIREKARIGGAEGAALRFTLLARTAADVRDVVVEGESGILAVSPPSERPEYFPSKRRLVWPNGNIGLCATGDEPDALRGIQSHYSWADELAAHRQIQDQMGLTAWDQLRVSTRLGKNPQILATTTPKKVPVIRSLLDEAEKNPGRVVVTRGSTMDNAGNLSEAYMDALLGVYEGTLMARQEIYGELLDDIDGALWTEEMIERYRLGVAPLGLPLRVVGVDPTVAERPGKAHRRRGRLVR
jgi:phage terminase large subunit-like protein